MARTVSEVLTAAMDSVNLINSINTDAASEAGVEGLTQAQINDVVQRNVEHLEIILMYEPQDDEDDTPDVAGSDEDKTPYTDAIATGKAYIENN
jgi:hypothetical protein